MKITDISERRKGLSIVFADGEVFSVNTETLVAAGIKKGDEISEAELNRLCESSECDRAKTRAFWYLSRSDHSKKALYDKLCRSFSPAASENATDRMQELGLIDDAALAKRLATYWSESNISKNEISRKLFAKGIPRDIAKAVTEELDTAPAEQLSALLASKYKNRLASEDGVKKVYAALIRKGFSYSDVKAALKKYSEEIDYSEE